MRNLHGAADVPSTNRVGGFVGGRRVLFQSPERFDDGFRGLLDREARSVEHEIEVIRLGRVALKMVAEEIVTLTLDRPHPLGRLAL